MANISNYIIPLFVLFIIIYGIRKKVDVYDSFIDGTKESFPMIITIFPNLLGMIFGVNILIKSGLLEFVFNLLKPLFTLIQVPFEVVPMMLIKPISGGAALAILNNIFASVGPDSFTGRLASIIEGSTETTIYVLTLYFGSVGIKKIKYALWAGLLADLIGIVGSVIIANILF